MGRGPWLVVAAVARVRALWIGAITKLLRWIFTYNEDDGLGDLGRGGPVAGARHNKRGAAAPAVLHGTTDAWVGGWTGLAAVAAGRWLMHVDLCLAWSPGQGWMAEANQVPNQGLGLAGIALFVGLM